MKLTKLHIALIFGATMFSTTAFAGPGGHNPSDYPRRIADKKEAMECCVPKAKIALACKDCKTLDVKGANRRLGRPTVPRDVR